ncbi:hypothetical protein SESBI_00107 [Sesbania bispinosa]|nr:hypothetical protein SESBI_00107 [Sesbania bispinosa]
MNFEVTIDTQEREQYQFELKCERENDTKELEGIFAILPSLLIQHYCHCIIVFITQRSNTYRGAPLVQDDQQVQKYCNQLTECTICDHVKSYKKPTTSIMQLKFSVWNIHGLPFPHAFGIASLLKAAHPSQFASPLAIGASNKTGSVVHKFRRTVTNVGDGAAT